MKEVVVILPPVREMAASVDSDAVVIGGAIGVSVCEGISIVSGIGSLGSRSDSEECSQGGPDLHLLNILEIIIND